LPDKITRRLIERSAQVDTGRPQEQPVQCVIARFKGPASEQTFVGAFVENECEVNNDAILLFARPTRIRVGRASKINNLAEFRAVAEGPKHYPNKFLLAFRAGMWRAGLAARGPSASP
jgi:hypothetical protein